LSLKYLSSTDIIHTWFLTIQFVFIAVFYKFCNHFHSYVSIYSMIPIFFYIISLYSQATLNKILTELIINFDSICNYFC